MALTDKEYLLLEDILVATECTIIDNWDSREPHEWPEAERFEIVKDQGYGMDWKFIKAFPTERALLDWLIKKTLK
jgi:hypothetical protein